MAELRIVIPDRLEQKLQSAMPDYLDRKGFVCLLLDQALTGGCNVPAYRVGAGTQEGLDNLQPADTGLPKQPQLPEKAVQAVSPSKAKRFEPVVTARFEKIEADVLAFWKTKQGSKNETAWKLLLTELGKIQDKYGDQVLVEQLQAGAQSGKWSSCTLANYEKFKPKAAANEPEHRHPSSREFRNGRFVDEIVTNPVTGDLF